MLVPPESRCFSLHHQQIPVLQDRFQWIFYLLQEFLWVMRKVVPPRPRSNLFSDQRIQLKWNHQNQKETKSLHSFVNARHDVQPQQQRNGNINNNLLWHNEKFRFISLARLRESCCEIKARDKTRKTSAERILQTFQMYSRITPRSCWVVLQSLVEDAIKEQFFCIFL